MQVAKVRHKMGLTQRELAERVGVSRSLVSMIECGAIRPYASIKRRIAQALETEPEKIFK